MVQLGKERSAAVLSTMREGEVEEITAEIARLESVDAAMAQRVMDEFEELVIAHRYYSRGGLAFAREVLDFIGFLREGRDRAEWRDLMNAQTTGLATVWDNPEDKVWDDV